MAWDVVNSGDLERAFALFEQAYRLDPNDEWSINGYGHILRETGQLTQAIEILQAGHDRFAANQYIRGNLISAYIVAGNASRDAGDFVSAAEFFQQAARIEPDDEWLLLNHGVLSGMQRRWPEALEMLNRGRALYPGNSYFAPNLIHIYVQYSQAMAQNENLSDAVAILLEAHSRFPEEPWIYTHLSDFLKQQGELEAAGEQLVELAALISNRGLIEKDGVNLEKMVYHKMADIMHKLAGNNQFGIGFRILDALQQQLATPALVRHLRGVLTFHAGQRESGVELVYQAYEEYTAGYPELTVPVTIGLPVKGVYAVAGNSSQDAITHAGFNRFCFDFMGSSPEGDLLVSGGSALSENNEDYRGFGDSVYCPVDGIVEEVVDHFPDLAPSQEYRFAEGNHIVIQDEQGRHYLFVHLKQSSAQVAVGQSIAAGAMIAEVGNSGLTTIPHLHFGVYSPDWVLSLPVRFLDYATVQSDGTLRAVAKGVPEDHDIIIVREERP